MKKSLGQHFLSDPRILSRIADALGDVADATVLEIGPGRGTLTTFLVERAGRVIAIEKDRDLLPALRRGFPAVAVAEGDAVNLDWHALVGDGRWCVAGNIPYNITSPLLEKALTPPRPERIVFLVQKEVADRLVADPGGGDYGAFSVGVQAAATVELLFGVPSGAFRPPPKVESAVVRLTPRDNPLIPDTDVRSFRRFVVGLFSFRRKMLRRGLRGLAGGDGETTEMILGRVGIN
ncbi:MAG: 16S rRNA (adenine(1518)-N(6)/adenine(1519)-N(6))-dimethyltransferase RsmA, partial [Gemmatimonadales bacterium]